MGLVHAGQGRPEEARQALRHVREAYSAVNNYVQVGSTVVAELRRVVLPYQADHLVERNRLAAEAEEAWKRASGAMTDFSPRFAALPLLILEGHWREARQLALAVYVSTTTSWWPLRAASMLGPLAHNQGDSSLAWQLIQQVLPAGSTTALGVVLFAEGLILAGLAAMLAIDARDLMTAQVWLETYHHWLTSSGSVLGQSEGQRLWATYLRTAGDAAEARQHAALALDLATKPRQPLAMLAAHRLLGELDTVTGAYAEAQAHLDQALALAEACAAPYERALTLLALTELRHATGSRDAAQAALDEARPVLERLEARPALARAAALAIRGG